jgi:hypothetical protein
VEARQGIGLIICEPRRIRKLKQLGLVNRRIGGTAGGKIWTRKNIRTIKLGNGLGVPNQSMPVSGITTIIPGIAAGWYPDKMNGLNTPQPYWCSLYRVILPRGGYSGVVAAGSDPNNTAVGYDFKGNIGKIKINNRGGGSSTNLEDCVFISSIQPVVKIKDINQSVNSEVRTVNGSFPIDPTYPRLK